jgi:hypothetical protein
MAILADQDSNKKKGSAPGTVAKGGGTAPGTAAKGAEKTPAPKKSAEKGKPRKEQ